MPARREDIDDEEVQYLYNVEHWTLQEIADYLGVSEMTIYYRLHPEKKKEQYEKHRDQILEQKKGYYEEHRDHILEQKKEYFQTENGIAARKKGVKKYFQTEKGKLAKKKAVKKYYQTENGKITKSKINAKHRELGFIQVNHPFPNSQPHHIDMDHVIHMPAELHRSIKHNVRTDEGMEEINEVAFEYITDEEFERLESGELDKEVEQ